MCFQEDDLSKNILKIEIGTSEISAIAYRALVTFSKQWRNVTAADVGALGGMDVFFALFMIA